MIMELSKRRPFFLLICLFLTGSCRSQHPNLTSSAINSECHPQRESNVGDGARCTAHIISRQLDGDGAHRILHTSLLLSCAIFRSSGIRIGADDVSNSTKVMLRIIEGLPSGLFADTFEIERTSLPGEMR